MAVKDGLIGDIVMWSFLGAVGVLVATHVQAFSTAISTAAAPVEYETSMIATAGASTAPTTTKKAS